MNGLWRVILPLSWMTVLFTLSSVPASSMPATPLLFPHQDKVIHAGLYGILALTFIPGRGQRLLARQWWPGAFAACSAFALLDEYHQSYVPGRSADPWDLLADGVGAALALLLAVRLSGPLQRASWTPRWLQALLPYTS